MEKTSIDRGAIERLAKALVFICGADHPTTVAFKNAVETGSDSAVKQARAMFLRLKAGDRQAALRMIEE